MRKLVVATTLAATLTLLEAFGGTSTRGTPS